MSIVQAGAGSRVGIVTEQLWEDFWSLGITSGPQYAEFVDEASITAAAQVELGSGDRLSGDTAQFFMLAIGTAHPYVIVVVDRHGTGIDTGDTGVVDDALVISGAYAPLRVNSAGVSPGQYVR